MQIERSKPFSRGVVELQYLSGEEAAGPLEHVLPVAVLAAVAWRTKGMTRLAAAAGAAYLARRRGMI